MTSRDSKATSRRVDGGGRAAVAAARPHPDASRRGSVARDDGGSVAALAVRAAPGVRVGNRKTPRQHVERLRLERAASTWFPRASILDVALDCGFLSHEVFTRAFKRTLWMHTARISGGPRRKRLSPTSGPTTRLKKNWTWAGSPRQGSPGAAADGRVHPTRGAYEEVPIANFDKLLSALKQRRLAVNTPLIGIAHDSPALTAASQLRFDACAVVPDDTKATRRLRCSRFRKPPWR